MWVLVVVTTADNYTIKGSANYCQYFFTDFLVKVVKSQQEDMLRLIGRNSAYFRMHYCVKNRIKPGFTGLLRSDMMYSEKNVVII